MAKRKSKAKRLKSTKDTSIQEIKSTGLGDTVEKVLKATGIDKAAKFILGEDCGCDERREVLNKAFPYNKPECLTEDEYNYLDGYFTRRSNTVTQDMQKNILAIYNRVFKDNVQPTGCGSCFLSNVHKKIEVIYKEYKNE